MSSTDSSGWQPPTPDSSLPGPDQRLPGQSAQEPGYGAYSPGHQTYGQPTGTPPPGQAPGYGPPSQAPGHGPGYQTYGSPTGAPPAGAGGLPPYGGPAVIAPRPGIIPLRPLTFSDILGGAFESLRANPRAMFIPSLVVMAGVGLLSTLASLALNSSQWAALASGASSSDLLESASNGQIWQRLIEIPLTSLASTILTGLLIVTVSRTILGRVATPGEVWQRTRARIWALIGQSLLISVAFLLLMVLAVLPGALILLSGGGDPSPGVIATGLLLILGGLFLASLMTMALYMKLCVAPAALILEHVGALEGIRRSWRLSRGFFWRITGVRIVAFLIVLVASSVLTFPLQLLFGVTVGINPDLTVIGLTLTTFLTAVVTALVLPFDAAVTALLYTDLRMRSEGLDIELRRAAEA